MQLYVCVAGSPPLIRLHNCPHTMSRVWSLPVTSLGGSVSITATYRLKKAARSCLLGWSTKLQAERLQVRDPMRYLNCINLSNPSGRTKPGVYKSSHWINKDFLGAERGRCVRLTNLLTYVTGLSRKCGILNIREPYRPPQPVTGIALLF
jgi:hypothetical protein